VKERGRFAPSTTGAAHPGTLLAALLAWLDARARQADIVLRLEDIDPERCRPEHSQGMLADLAWLGLDWDEVAHQHERRAQHEAALDQLAEKGVLYPCACSRSDLKAHGRRAPDGSFAYPNTCRARRLPAEGWRASTEPLRVRLPEGVVRPLDESGLDLSQDPAQVMGDPIVRRRDTAIAYQLAVVVDDAAQGITRVVRGRDIAPSTATQVALQTLLGLPHPTYRHHFLLLEPRPDTVTKLAKLHGSVGAPELRAHYDAASLTGWLAFAAGLVRAPTARTPRQLLNEFDWPKVPHDDRVVHWDGRALSLG
jgi:glutamyl-tRNA synthetase/glutamyl-Q tRNA(Asp) synthetase